MKTKVTVSLLVLAMAIASAGTTHAQAEAANAQEQTKMYIELRYEMPNDNPILKSFSDRGLDIGRSTTATRTRAGSDVSTFLEVKGSEELLGEFLNAVRAFNPSPNIEVTIHMIEASRRDGEENIPKKLDEVVEKLRDTFGYPRFSLLDTILIRHRSGNEANVSGVLPTALPELGDLGQDLSIFYRANMVSRVRTAVDPNVIEIENFQLSMQVPYLNIMYSKEGEAKQTLGFKDVGFGTSITCREGQQVVLGKANVNGSSDALFVVVSARVVE